ncbi:MAG TPA: hypothetical protein VM715_04215, partial [Candidatus Acidoferrum sp.]|nr:hypothetical protein [Candidatus Acidoferrum sp.]
LQPGATDLTKNKRFQWFVCEEKPLKRLYLLVAGNTGLKPGVNGMSNQSVVRSSGHPNLRDTEVPPT